MMIRSSSYDRKQAANVLVGKSTHSLEQARAAQREGADYIGFGPIFATPDKTSLRFRLALQPSDAFTQK
jgi:thiamine monophosphate synthase